MWPFLLWHVLAPARANGIPASELELVHGAPEAPPHEAPRAPHTVVAEEIEDDEHRGKTHDRHHVIAVRAQSSAVFKSDGPHGAWGLGLFYEIAAVPHWLEVKVSVSGLIGRDGTSLITELTFEKPFVLAPAWELHLGLGPHMQVLWPHPNTAPHEEHGAGPHYEPGGVVALDVFTFPSEHVGLVAEADVAVVAELLDEGAVARVEASLGAGVAFRF